MKINTKVVIDMASGEILEEESFEYDGPVAMCGDSGGDGVDKEYNRRMAKIAEEQHAMGKQMFNFYKYGTFDAPEGEEIGHDVVGDPENFNSDDWEMGGKEGEGGSVEFYFYNPETGEKITQEEYARNYGKHDNAGMFPDWSIFGEKGIQMFSDIWDDLYGDDDPEAEASSAAAQTTPYEGVGTGQAQPSAPVSGVQGPNIQPQAPQQQPPARSPLDQGVMHTPAGPITRNSGAPTVAASTNPTQQANSPLLGGGEMQPNVKVDPLEQAQKILGGLF